MNKIENGKTTLNGFGIALLAIAILALASGITVMVISTSNALNVGMLVLGILLLVSSLLGIGLGVALTWIGFSIKATNGSILEENLALGTINMHKCENCGEEISEEETLCERCKEIIIE